MTRMRNQAAKQAFNVAAGDQQEDEEQDNRDNSDQLSSSRLSPLPSRGKRKQERANKSRPNEMTEEEMMDLALRLSEQEASIVAIKRQKEEEEAMKKAIQESMSQQDQPCPPSESQSLLDETDAPSIICTRRKLTYSNGRSSSVSQEASGCTSEKIQKRGTKRSREESVMSLKRKRKEGSPLLEMPDLSQTQKIHSQISASSSRVLDLQLDSMQSSDSTQIQEFPLQKSPFFPSSYRKAEVRLSRLSQDPVHSGIVWSSQDSTPLRSLPAHCRSLTFPKSPKCSGEQVSRKSPVFSESSREDGGESTSENCRSPVFAGNSQSRTCPSPRRDPVLNCNSGLALSSQESLTSVARTESCRSQSPVFPRSPGGLPATCQSPGFSDNCEGEAEDLLSRSPVFDGTDPLPQTRLEVQKHSMKEDGGAVPCHPVGLNQVSGTVKPALVLGRPGEELEDRSRNAEQQLSGNMTLLWSDEDEDLTQVDSPSPVFPEERLVQRAEEQPASLDPPGGSPGPSASTRSGEPPSEQEAASSSTVHYYWGVPFCPRGLHPDSYTQVILAQLEVYEKSLKQAQRRLLRKAEWGEAIIPQPEKSPQPTHHSPADSPQEDFTGRRVIRLRRKKLHDAGDAPAAAEEAEEEEEGGEEDGEQTQEGGQVDTDDCHVCPETQLSNVDEDRTQDVMVVDAAAQLPSKSPELLDVDMILGDDSPAADEQLEEADIDALLESNSEGGVSDRVQKEEEGVEPDMVRDPGETGDRGQLRSTSPELDLSVRGSSVDCPMCLRSFPMTEIEVHAAYCDGEDKSTSHQASLKPRRKRARKAGEDEAGESSSTAREKCYICQALVPVGGYGRHTELCIQQQEAKKENLLSALDKTESRASEARPSGSKVQPGYVIDLLNEEEEEEEEGAVRISNSPIRSFTPISEATDCLIDFRRQQQQQQQQQQRSRKLSRRRR